MPRRMSVALTLPAVRARTKTVTRRAEGSWMDLKAGDELVLIEKGMGLAKGERQVVVDHVTVTDVRVEPLVKIFDEPDGTAREGLPHMTPAEFCQFWADSHHATGQPIADLRCRRIEFTYNEETTTP